MNTIGSVKKAVKESFTQLTQISSWTNITYTGWILVSLFWVCVALVNALHCFIYTEIVHPNISNFFISFEHTLIRWLPWILFTPFLINHAKQLDDAYWNIQLLVKKILLITITWGLALPISFCIFQSFNTTDSTAKVSVFYTTLVKEIPLFLVATSCLLTLWRYQISKISSPPPPSDSIQQVESLLVETRQGTEPIDIPDIEHISASGNYVVLCTFSGKQYMHRATMKSVMQSLDQGLFIRIHRSSIINKNAVKKVRTATHGEIKLTLSSGQDAIVSRHYAKKLRQEYATPLKQLFLAS
ncbi:LytTR family DNA-binding domain-containing protein [Teredinibacter sp. KSP-S5-2]|uniref:LytR/AlgR family response regulator transcription factor n=1 Tax=Teredinibacter sp. KSP-S5-2 TaxID=3034506 RepID=UPI00293492FA|nr:LytTR family DNA-binding domain-containing protein [Teredinibacter sp. KSP-S5-2]WNO10781.1 LytTR family DNA-binding domain-containing protein [Teredinibacter sp. KSP-S5-2]